MHAVQERTRAFISDYLASDTSTSRDAIKPGDKEIGVLISGIQARMRQNFDLNPHTGHIYPFNAKDSRKREVRDTFESVTEGGESFRVKGSGWRERPETTYSLLGCSTVVHDARLQADYAKFGLLSAESRTGWRIDPDRIVRLVGWKKVPSICQIKQLIEKCTGRPKDWEAYEEKELRILLERKYRHISEITDPRAFWLAFLRFANCAYRFYSKGRILHRDISINTLGYSKYGYWKEVGVLMDFDPASLGISEEYKSHSRSGTAPFMAREVLDCEEDYTPKFHHELESLFYVLVWHTLGYSTSGGKYPSEVLDGWRKGSWDTILCAKKLFITETWDGIFPQTDSSKGYLHIRCRALCALYSRVAMVLGTDKADIAISLLPFTDGSIPPPRPANTEINVTYKGWLKIVGENDA